MLTVLTYRKRQIWLLRNLQLFLTIMNKESVPNRFTLTTDSANAIAAASLNRNFVRIKIKPVKQMKELQQMKPIKKNMQQIK